MQTLLIFVVLAAVLIFLAFLEKRLIGTVTVFEHERGLKYTKGTLREVLAPGRYRIYRPHTLITKLDMRPRFISVPGQELLSSDGVTLKVSLAAEYEVADPQAAVLKSVNFESALYLLLQVALRELIGASKIDEVLEKRGFFSQALMEACGKRVEEMGLKLRSVNVKDVMFPGELKKIFSQTVKARKEGLAALEKARGETAALRNLANAARMIEENPALMQVRLLQHLSETPGNTLILGVPGATTPLPVRSKEIERPPSAELRPPEEKE